MRQVSINGLLAVGMTFVILTAGIDLSVGSLLAFAGLVAAAVAKGGLADRFSVGAGQEAAGYGWGLALLAAIAVGVAGGLIQGVAITRLKVPPFVVTLGGMSAFRGAALLFAGGGPISGFPRDYTWWGQGRIGRRCRCPVIIFVAFAIARPCRAALHALWPASLCGRRQSGGGAALGAQRPPDHRSVYVIIGFFAGLGAFVLSARLNSAEAVAGTGNTSSPSSPRW